MDENLLKIVAEDLDYITKEWNAESMSDENLRRSSTVLRSLLIEGRLFAAAKMLKHKGLRVLNSKQDLTSILGTVLHQSGGGRNNGIRVENVTVWNRALTQAEVTANYEASRKQHNKPMELSEFMRSPSITIQGIGINGEEIIKYVSNKLGGAHYDATRKEPLDKDGSINLEGKYQLLDRYQDGHEVAGKNAVYFELLSIGQKLVNNYDIQKLKRKIKTHLVQR